MEASPVPTASLDERFVKSLTWTRAVQLHGDMQMRREGRDFSKAVERGDEDPNAAAARWTQPQQIPFRQTLRRGVALVLLVGRGGGRSWHAQTYTGGKPSMLKLGTWPELRAEEARKLALKFYEDPSRFQAKTLSYVEAAEDRLKRFVIPAGLVSAREIERRLRVYIKPRWKDRPITSIRRTDVTKLLDEVADQHGPTMAEKAGKDLAATFKWYGQRHDEHFLSPLAPGLQVHPRTAKERARTRVLTHKEIRLLWRAAEQTGMAGVLARLCLLTAQRVGAVTAMPFQDLQGDVWTLPRRPRSKGDIEQVRLPPLAMAILEAQRGFGKEHVVSNATSKGNAYGSLSSLKDQLDKALPAEFPSWTWHDLRRSARSLLSEAGVRPDIAEKVLGHATDFVEFTYDRHTYLREKSEALARLAEHIEAILSEGRQAA
jgi:integrase